MGRLKKPPALPFAALNHPLWDYGIVFALRWDTAVTPGGGRSFTAASYPSSWPFGGGDYGDVYIPRGRATASAMALLGPWPDSSMFWRRSVPCCPPLGCYLHGGHSGHRNHSPGVGGRPRHQILHCLGGARHQTLLHE